MSDEVTDFERDAISFVLELGQKCGLKPQEAFQRLGSMRHRLSELRTKWVEEIDTMLGHVIRERDEHKKRIEVQAKAIDLASMALDDWKRSGSTQSIVQAKAFLESVLPLLSVDPTKWSNGQETPGEAP